MSQFSRLAHLLLDLLTLKIDGKRKDNRNDHCPGFSFPWRYSQVALLTDYQNSTKEGIPLDPVIIKSGPTGGNYFMLLLNHLICHISRIWQFYIKYEKLTNPGVDPGEPHGPGLPLTLVFEGPKLSIFGPYLIFP